MRSQRFGFWTGFGLASFIALGAVALGSTARTEAVIGLTGFERDGVHHSIAWTRSGGRLTPVASGSFSAGSASGAGVQERLGEAIEREMGPDGRGNLSPQ